MPSDGGKNDLVPMWAKWTRKDREVHEAKVCVEREPNRDHWEDVYHGEETAAMFVNGLQGTRRRR